jgi:hydrogenase maturation protease
LRRGCVGSVRVRVIGVGNPLYGDDAIGYCMARAVQECCKLEGADVVALEFLELGSIPLMEGCEAIVFLDAGALHPRSGDYVVLELDTTRLTVQDAVEVAQGLEPHSVDPLRLAVLARSAGVYSGPSYLVLVKARRVGVGVPPSSEALASAVKALKALERLLGDLGVAVSTRGEKCYWESLARCSREGFKKT